MNQMQWADGCGGGVAPEATDSRLHTAFAFIGREGRDSDRVGMMQPKADRFPSLTLESALPVNQGSIGPNRMEIGPKFRIFVVAIEVEVR